MQVQVGQRIHKRYTESPLSLYRALRSLNPSPYMYFYNFGDFQVVGASPEILVRQEQREEGTKVTIRPLAGTRPRGATPEKDKATEVELLNDPKERAEHVMLIDLARNDIGRIAKTGSVKVTEAFAVERYSHVMHIVSNVEGIAARRHDQHGRAQGHLPGGHADGRTQGARHGTDRPAGTHQARHLRRRGGLPELCRAHGRGALPFAPASSRDGTLYVQAAAGVVADSVPELEWKETEHKARALLRAAELVEEGLE